MALNKLTLFKWGKQKSVEPQDGLNDFGEVIKPTEQHIVVNGNIYVFGLQWEISFAKEQRNAEIQLQKKQGNQYHVVSAYEDSIGYARTLPEIKGNKYAGALQLAAQHSQGGVEIFCFKLNEDSYAMVVLNDYRPVPGHDVVNSKGHVLQLENNVISLHPNQTLRYVGNSELFDMEESLSIEDAFSHPDAATKLKKILNLRAIYAGVAGVLVLFGGLVGLDHYLTLEQEEANAQRQAQLNNPNTLYEKQIDPALSAVGSGGSELIAQWINTIKKLPLKTAGWNLVSVKCTVTECTALWQREYGNFNELFKSLPIPFTNTTESLETNRELTSTATTTHPVAPLEKKHPITRDDLPIAKQVLRLFSSQLQDFSLLEEANVSMDKPKLFPETSQGTLESLSRPVVKGTWSFKHQLWSLDSLNLYPFVVPETIEISFANSQTKQTHTGYELKGSFYALYK